MNTTTERFARTARRSGTEYASAGERARRADKSRWIIIIGCALLMALPYLILAARS